MKAIYIAGAYTAPNAWEREQNIRRAEAAALQLWQAGVPAICVHAIARHFYGAVAEADAIAIDFAILERCDAVLLTEGWAESAGTKAEIERARELGMEVWSVARIDDLIAWAKGHPTTDNEWRRSTQGLEGTGP